MAPVLALLASAALCALGSALPLQQKLSENSAPKKFGGTTQKTAQNLSGALENPPRFASKRYPASSAPGSKSVKEKQKTISDIILSANANVSRPLFQGDIARHLGRSVLQCGSCRWQKVAGVVSVPFTIDATYSNYEKGLIRSALEEFYTVCCVRFIERTSEMSYISIENTPGCWSYIGKNGNGQPVSLQSTRCMSYGVIQHEVMHALSINHEHTRPDRDNYVDIMWQYISSVNQGDFQLDKGDTLNTPYNYNSVMHYSRTTFTNTSGKATIIPKPDPNVFIGQRNGLSRLDVVTLNRLYDCNLCRTKLLGSSGSFSSSDASPSLPKDNCLWLLHVLVNKVFLQFSSFISSPIDCDAQIIVYNGVTKSSSILAKIDPNRPPPVLISSGLFMVVEYVTDQNCSSSFSASYSTVVYGGTFTSNNSFVTSTKYPDSYPNSVQDTSIIIAPAGFRVFLKFILFDLESSPSCSKDYLAVRDGGDTNAPVLGTYCGTRTDLRLSSTGQMMLLKFSSNSQTVGQGFRAEITFVSANDNS
ncbi:astacin-like metalloendopeptidase [Anomaloglossus baeobatrachus]|uniref:astacin-like metalloendopeptidase n=1 Tax=Anomaloglossus baeobatrachus TaxID=238106 RepID=UPI003F4FE58D